MQAMSPCNRHVRPQGLLCSLSRSLPAAVLVLTLGLLNLSGCAGGFQGYRPVGPTVSQPASVTVPVGQTATFSVTAAGSGPLSYQWFKNGVAIVGATSNSYTTSATVAGDSGSLFTVTVTNPVGSVTSLPGTLTVQLPDPVAGSIVPSSATPPYNSSIFLVPTFSGARLSSVPPVSAVPTSRILRLAEVLIRRLY